MCGAATERPYKTDVAPYLERSDPSRQPRLVEPKRDLISLNRVDHNRAAMIGERQSGPTSVRERQIGLDHGSPATILPEASVAARTKASKP